MKLSLAVLAVALLTFAHPARADTFQMNGGGFFLSGIATDTNGKIVVGPIVETFDTSFIYDTLSGSVSDMSITAQGLLGTDFAFTGVGNDGFDTLFQWSNSESILTGAFLNQDFAFASKVHFPVNSHGTKAILLNCLTEECAEDFVNPITGAPGSPFVGTFMSADFLGPSPVPEPSSLTLLASGLLGGAFLLRRRITRL